MLSKRRAFNCLGFVQLHKEPALLICSSRVNVCDETSEDAKRGGGEIKELQEGGFQELVTKTHSFN